MYDVRMDDCSKAGKAGEDAVRRLYEQEGYIVKDVSGRKLGYDLIVSDPLHRYADTKVEVKTDGRMQETGNIFIETAIERPDGHIQTGWANTSTTDTLAYIDVGNEVVYFLKFERVIQYVFENQHKFSAKNTANPYDKGSFCGGIAVPIHAIYFDIPDGVEGCSHIPGISSVIFPRRYDGKRY